MQIEGSKQQQLTFDKGITNVPSDAICSDNALEESLGMIYDNGEHRVIQNPVVKFSSFGGGKILYVHKYNDDERFIALSSATIYWYNSNGTSGTQLVSSLSGDIQVASIGKTLIVSDNNGLHYFLWKASGYDSMSEIPDPEFQFWLEGNTNDDYVVNMGSDDGMVVRSGDYPNYTYEIAKGKQEEWNDRIIGLYAKNKKQIAQKKAFCLPFFVRTALELYDGTYTHISNPILLFPCVTQNSSVVEGEWDVSVLTRFLKLKFSQTKDLLEWSDVVKDVVVFATAGIEVFDLLVDQKINTATQNTLIHDCVKKTSSTYAYQSLSLTSDTTTEKFRHRSRSAFFPEDYAFISPLVSKTSSEIDEAIKGASQFYKICSVGLNPVSSKDIGDYIDAHVLENLTTQEFLKEDDYYSRCTFSAKFIYAYNSRLNLANVKRGFFEGFNFFTPFSNGNANVTVYIKTDSGFRLETQSNSAGARLYYFYPDSRATDATIGSSTYKLTEHAALHGAYYFAGIDAVKGGSFPSGGGSSHSNEISKETLGNYIIQSEVNNPWLFKAAGYFKVGTGKILGMSSTTHALSEGQFGQYPLLVFSESGIWALSVASTGYYDSVHPLSREVALKLNPCITQTDGAVFFASEKGLMVVSGNQVKCVSEQLSGKTNSFAYNGTEHAIGLGNFVDFLRNGIIAYDYRDSLLWIFDKTHTACWVYSIKDSTFGKYDFGTGNAVTNVVNYYPDYLLQSAGNVLSLIGRPNINTDVNKYSGYILSRPMKFENALALKSIMQIKHIHDIPNLNKTGASNPTLALRIFASNNLTNWVELSSLMGTPWKYYRFRYDFGNIKPTDRFAGSVIITQERRTNKLR